MTSPGPWTWKAGELRDANGAGVPFDWLAPQILLLPDMLVMLRELEWAGHDCMSLCPVCGERPERQNRVHGGPVPGRPGFVFETGRMETIPGGHKPDCALGSLLDKLGRDRGEP